MSLDSPRIDDAIPDTPLESAEALEERLRMIGATRYHDLHPFHDLLHGGKLSRGQVQAWALNRYYYQSSIPLKDAIVISRFRDRTIRIEWRHRIEDHDGAPDSEGGIERWLKLTDGLSAIPHLYTYGAIVVLNLIGIVLITAFCYYLGGIALGLQF